jgi:uncharacterized protein with PIN domain
MPRRGRCRCGSVLSFEKGPNGYKTRCPSCGSVVRLSRGAVRTPATSRMVACPCGASLSVRSGRKRTICPDCKRKLVVTRKPGPRSVPLPAAELESGRTVTCETCHRIVSAQASECPGCGGGLALTTAAPILKRQPPSVAAVAKAFSYRPTFGWLAGVAAGTIVAILVLIFSLRH